LGAMSYLKRKKAFAIATPEVQKAVKKHEKIANIFRLFCSPGSSSGTLFSRSMLSFARENFFKMLHSSQSHPLLRKWSSGQPNAITASSLVYPIFIAETGMDIPSLPGVSRIAVSNIVEHLSPLVSKGLASVLVFPVPSASSKSLETLDSPAHNPAIPAIRAIRSAFPNLLVCVDVCLCAFTENGHCGIINSRGCVDSPLSHPYMVRLTSAYVEAGAQVIAPSDMMDNRIGAIKTQLTKSNCHDVAVMSYSAKFASCFYGPFRYGFLC
jgi:porphobilinogen synthase